MAGSKAFSPANAGTEWEHSRSAWYAHADAVLAVRDLALEQARASRDRWRRDYVELADRHKRMLAELEASQRRAVALVERIDAARAWARQHLTPELEAGLLGVLRGDQPKETRP
jgi:hypothetical protein